MITEIKSKDNHTLKLIKGLGQKKFRDKNKKFIAEGKRLVSEALEHFSANIFCIVVSDLFIEKNTDFVKTLDDSDFNIYTVPNSLFTDISDTDTPQGIIAVLNIPVLQSCDTAKMNNILILDGVSEPGNMGTIIRTAEAMGIDAIYLRKGCADIFSPKVVRSTMGSLFRTNFVIFDLPETIDELKRQGFTIIATALRNSEDIEKIMVNGKRAIVIGNEANGVSKEVLDLSDKIVRIQMKGNVESLNAAVAAAIVMYKLSI